MTNLLTIFLVLCAISFLIFRYNRYITREAPYTIIILLWLAWFINALIFIYENLT